MISVLILTRNEERDLPGCLESVRFSDDVHVFDSESTDGTVEIARAAGATVAQRAFTTYAEQRNAALTTTEFRYPWLLILDADERSTPELVREMQRAVQEAPEAVAGFRMRRRDYLFGTWLRHAQMSPLYIRLVRPERARYTRNVNELLEVDGEVRELTFPFDHFPFSKGFAHWIAKHNLYSTLEAELILSGEGTRQASLGDALTQKDFHQRRAAQKALFYRMPARPLLKWIYLVVARGAWLDGRAGITYATLQTIYEYMIVLKTRELRRKEIRCACDL